MRNGKCLERRGDPPIPVKLHNHPRRVAPTLNNKMNLSPTPHSDVNEILNLLYTDVKEILQDQLVGMYLFGSLANGDFDNDSDIDVLFVTKSDVSEKMLSTLHVMHTEISKMDLPWATQLEVSYIPQKALRQFNPADKLHPHIDRGDGEVLHRMSHDSDWIIQRYILRERGITISGPDLKFTRLTLFHQQT